MTELRLTSTGGAVRPGETRRRRSLSRTLGEGSTHVVLVLFCIVALLPFVSILLISVFPTGQPVEALTLPRTINFANYLRAWNVAGFGSLMRSSLVVAVLVVPLGSVLCVLTGYAFGTMRFPFKNVVFLAFLIGLLMPFEATIVPLYYDLRAFGLVDTYPGLILPETALFLSFGTFWMRGAFQSAEPSLIEAARIDGANSWTILWRVLVPTLWPAVTTMMVLFFIWSWNEFLLALVLAQDPSVQTAPAGLGLFVGQHSTDLTGLAAAAVIMTIPSLIVYVLLQRQFIQGVTSGSVKG